MSAASEADPSPATVQIAWVFESTLTSEWLKAALRSALEGDPIGAANEAAILADVLRRYVGEASATPIGPSN